MAVFGKISACVGSGSSLVEPKRSGVPAQAGIHLQRAFSLVELSIVLVILGLLVGGVLSGQSLIRAAELRSVSSEYSRYVAATQSFRDKYLALPGDMPNATQFWGRLNTNSDCAMNATTSSTSPGACDGNGDGFIGMGTTGANKSLEIYQFWRQLALAGMLEGTYTGLSDSATSAHVPGSNAPRSKLNNGGWANWCCAGFSGDYAGDTIYFKGNYYHSFMVGGAVAANWPVASLFKPEEAWNIDTKLDDGKPGTGKVLGVYWNNACATGASAATDTAIATYNLSNNALQCAMVFTNAY